MRRIKRVTPIPLKHRGTHAELLATVWLMSNGYEVFRNISAAGHADLVAWRPGKAPVLLDVKSTTESESVGVGRSIRYPKLRPDQVAAGVVPIYVQYDGNVVFEAASE